jgi:hypothetical protein
VNHCSHLSRVSEWGFNDKHDFIVTEYDCVLCGEKSPTPFPHEEQLVSIDHTDCDNNPCFGCKAKGLQLNTGDANHTKMVSNKKWDAENNAYAQARAEGIQPAGTSMAKIIEARKASEAMGKAFNADSAGVEAGLINNKTANKLKEVGLV